ncbi:hypothetical protein BpHYR1_041809 [Brachionus plicatilis]|uniref:Uncharacterized protein n=1 Tax=Brachionus plicatilis TaxID=10195 RepID=A0A3M7RBR4_BRAPC|nr:hypothetical protein BpHYR1_041809 [Brachionus plicatilis]
MRPSMELVHEVHFILFSGFSLMLIGSEGLWRTLCRKLLSKRILSVLRRRLCFKNSISLYWRLLYFSTRLSILASLVLDSMVGSSRSDLEVFELRVMLFSRCRFVMYFDMATSLRMGDELLLVHPFRLF